MVEATPQTTMISTEATLVHQLPEKTTVEELPQHIMTPTAVALDQVTTGNELETGINSQRFCKCWLHDAGWHFIFVSLQYTEEVWAVVCDYCVHYTI